LKIINGIEFRTKEEKTKPIERTKNLNLRFFESICSGAENISTENFTRRTLTIAPNVNRWIQNFRAASLQKYPEHELDYTTVANFLMALGTIFMQKYAVNEDDIQSLEALLDNFKQLRVFGILDLYDSLAKEKTTTQEK
jgi:hypothetical protein